MLDFFKENRLILKVGIVFALIKLPRQKGRMNRKILTFRRQKNVQLTYLKKSNQCL